MGVVSGAIKLIAIPIIFVVAVAVLGGLYLRHRSNKKRGLKDIEEQQAQLPMPPPPPGVYAAPPPPIYAPSPVQYQQYTGPAAAAKPAPVVQGYN